MRERQPAVYMMSNKKNSTIYTGVTSNLIKRVYEHKTSAIRGFTSKYGCKNLVWYELCDDMYNAISREKQIKAGSRGKKMILISQQNPEWIDLYDQII